MDNTTLLSLPLLANKQALQTTFHDEALKTLDALVMLSVIDRDLSSPPVSPEEGDRYIVSAPGSGDDAWQDDHVVVFVDGGWRAYAPRPGWTCYVQDEAALIVWDGSAWRPAVEMQNLALLGVGTTADASNPFAAKLNNALWSARYDGEGGDGDLRYKLNKEASGNTLSMLFQSDWSGRAEVGLTGDDDFHFKVSDDGAIWRDGIVIAAATGQVRFPQGAVGVREKLTTPRTYYVRTDGNDANDGLGNDAGGAFVTIQKAVDAVFGALDLGGFDVTIQLADGTYATGMVQSSPQVGSGLVLLKGNVSAPENVLIATDTDSDAISLAGGAVARIEGVKITTGTGRVGIRVATNASLYCSNIHIGPCGAQQIRAEDGGLITCTGSYTVTGGGVAHWNAVRTGAIQTLNNPTITLTGTPNFTQGFAVATTGGLMSISGTVFSGGATGPRYVARGVSCITTGNVGTAFLPGSAAGTVEGGAVYGTVNAARQLVVSTGNLMPNYGQEASLIAIDSASARTVTIPKDATRDFIPGTTFSVARLGIGSVQVVPEDGSVNVRSASGHAFVGAQYGRAEIVKIAANEWLLCGNLAAS